jgi:hypothetical protein
MKATSGRFTKRLGPRMMPWMTRAPAMMALVGLPGTPSARSGTREEATVALLALSAAMMPSGLPCSKVSGVFEERLASA